MRELLLIEDDFSFCLYLRCNGKVSPAFLFKFKMDNNRQKAIGEYVLNQIRERLSKIDYNQDKYHYDICSNGDYSYVFVKYDNKEFLRLNIPISKIEENNPGKCTGLFHVYAIDDAFWYNNLLTHINVNVNEKMMCEGNKLNDILDKRLPLGNDDERQRIEGILQEKGIDYQNVSFDTIHYRYVIGLEPQIGSCQQVSFKGDFVYKYTTLSTFLKIAKTRKIRLNSIVSMNDTSEAFFLGDYLCNAYNDNLREKNELCYDKMVKEGLRYSKLLEYKNYLIGSFTTNEDDPVMWERYGDKYKGVCIGFKYNSHNMKPIVYCGRNKEGFFYKLKTISEELHSEGIAIYFDFIGNEQFFVKHWQFESENEFRLLKECGTQDEEFQYDLYGDLMSYYREYELNEIDLEPVCLWIGAKIPNKDVNFPIICDLAKRSLGICNIFISNCNKFRF